MIYLILSFNLVFSFLVITYWLLFRDGHAFQQNRWLLLLIPVFSLLIPHIPRPVEWMNQTITERVQASIPFTSNPFEEDQDATNSEITYIQNKEENAPDVPSWLLHITWAKILLGFYLIGILVLLGRHLRQWRLLGRIFRQGEKSDHDGFTLIRSSRVSQPFSFFGWVVLPTADYRLTDYRQIIDHERIHVQQGHSWDLLIGEWLQILCWFNPLIKIYRDLVRNNLEYLVDDTLLQQGVDQRTYQYSLLSVSLGATPVGMGSNYNHSFIKRRISMMNTSKQNQLYFWKVGIIVIQILGILQLFGQKMPPITKGMQIILIGNDVPLDKLNTFQEQLRVSIEEASVTFPVVAYNTDGSFAAIEVEVTLPEVKASTSYEDAGVEDFAYLPLFVGVRGDGRISCDILNPQKLTHLIKLYDDLEIFAVGLNTSLEHLTQMLPDIQKKYQKRLAYMKRIRVSEGSPFSSAITFSTSSETENAREYPDLTQLLIDQAMDQGSMRLEYYLDGLKRDLNIDTLDFSVVDSVEVRTNGLKKEINGKEHITGVVQVRVFQK